MFERTGVEIVGFPKLTAHSIAIIFYNQNKILSTSLRNKFF